MRDDFGDRMKMYEKRETGRRFMPGIPVIARIDGKCFSKFTKKMVRPFDHRMVTCMKETTRYLVEETNAVFGYTQSDEITLVFYSDNPKSQIFFDGKVYKMTSVLAAMASMRFATLAMAHWKGHVLDTLPVFDCRVWQVPTKMEGMNAVLWRVKDAIKNSISMAASEVYSPKQLHGKTSSERQEMLFQKGINWNDYPSSCKEGSFLQRRQITRELTWNELERIPEKHRPTGPVTRSEVVDLDLPPFNSIINKLELIFDGVNPQTIESL